MIGAEIGPAMSTDWVASSTGLPNEGASVEFVLDHRNVAIDGTYTRQVFHSRWSGYEVERVRTWRSAEPDSGGPRADESARCI